MNEKEKGAATNDAPKGTDKPIVASDKAGVNKIPAWLSQWQVRLPHSNRECDQRARAMQAEMGRKIDRYAYEIGVLCPWKKERLDHGEYTKWIEETWHHSKRTIRNMVNYSIEAEMSLTYMRYNPNKSKTATVALLDSPDEAATERQKKSIPRKPDPEIPWTVEMAVTYVCHEIANHIQQCDLDELREFESKLSVAIEDCFKVERIEREGYEDEENGWGSGKTLTLPSLMCYKVAWQTKKPIPSQRRQSISAFLASPSTWQSRKASL